MNFVTILSSVQLWSRSSTSLSQLQKYQNLKSTGDLNLVTGSGFFMNLFLLFYAVIFSLME